MYCVLEAALQAIAKQQDVSHCLRCLGVRVALCTDLPRVESPQYPGKITVDNCDQGCFTVDAAACLQDSSWRVTARQKPYAIATTLKRLAAIRTSEMTWIALQRAVNKSLSSIRPWQVPMPSPDRVLAPSTWIQQHPRELS